MRVKAPRHEAALRPRNGCSPGSLTREAGPRCCVTSRSMLKATGGFKESHSL